MTEHFRTTKCDETCFETAHRKTCHCTVLLLCLCSEVSIYVRNEFVDKNLLKVFGCERVETTESHFVSHSVSHDDDERFNLALSDEVVHDEVGMSLV